MAWLGRVSLGGFPDLAGAVNKLSESVKNIEKNFDSALGLEEKHDAGGEASGIWPLASDGKALFEPVMAFMGQKGGESSIQDSTEKVESPENKHDSRIADEAPLSDGVDFPPENEKDASENKEEGNSNVTEVTSNVSEESREINDEIEAHALQDETSIQGSQDVMDSTNTTHQEELKDEDPTEHVQSDESEPTSFRSIDHTDNSEVHTFDKVHQEGEPQPDIQEIHTKEPQPGIQEFHSMEPQPDIQEIDTKEHAEARQVLKHESTGHVNVLDNGGQANSETNNMNSSLLHNIKTETVSRQSDENSPTSLNLEQSQVMVSETETGYLDPQLKKAKTKLEVQPSNANVSTSESVDTVSELEKVRKEMKMMEAALQGAARQAQAKADEIAKFMNENEQLKSTIEDLKGLLLWRAGGELQHRCPILMLWRDFEPRKGREK